VQTTDDVVAKLRGVANDVQALGDDPQAPGFRRFAIGAGATGPILKAAVDAGWTVGALGREHRTLEQVMKELQDQEIARQGGVAA
jgi:hypothetical protein